MYTLSIRTYTQTYKHMYPLSITHTRIEALTPHTLTFSTHTQTTSTPTYTTHTSTQNTQSVCTQRDAAAQSTQTHHIHT
jgi:hypothetical protein